jgi:ribosome-associated protein
VETPENQGVSVFEFSALAKLVSTILPPQTETRAGIRTPELMARSRRNACLVAQACDQFRGNEIVVLDLTGITPVFDYFVITSANNSRQMRAIVEGVDDVMVAHGSAKIGIEGYHADWICQDYGDVVLQVFTPTSRKHYDLEHLWGDAPHVDWQAELGTER